MHSELCDSVAMVTEKLSLYHPFRGFYVLFSDITPGPTLVSPVINQSDQISPYILF